MEKTADKLLIPDDTYCLCFGINIKIFRYLRTELSKNTIKNYYTKIPNINTYHNKF